MVIAIMELFEMYNTSMYKIKINQKLRIPRGLKKAVHSVSIETE